MMTKFLTSIVLIVGSIIAGAVHTVGEEPYAPHQAVELSPSLLDVLRAEMRALAEGVQSIALALPTADWKTIQDTSSKMQASYIMEKKLTPAQAKELAQVLPAHFKQLDTEFHQRAARLGVAAAAHDPELVAFHYARLVESCAVCHAAYARSRFPGFAPPGAQRHHH